MSKVGITVRDQHGNLVVRQDGTLQGGDVVHTSFTMMDAARASGGALLTDAERVQHALDGHRAARDAILRDAWMSPSARARDALFSGLSYPERMAIRSGALASHVKPSDRKVSDAEFYRRQRECRRLGTEA